MRQTVVLRDRDMASTFDSSGHTTLTASIMQSLINSASANDLFCFSILLANTNLPLSRSFVMMKFSQTQFVVASNFLPDQLLSFTVLALINCVQSFHAWFENTFQIVFLEHSNCFMTNQAYSFNSNVCKEIPFSPLFVKNTGIRLQFFAF